MQAEKEETSTFTFNHLTTDERSETVHYRDYDLSGALIGKVVVLHVVGNHPENGRKWACTCTSCGRGFSSYTSDLTAAQRANNSEYACRGCREESRKSRWATKRTERQIRFLDMWEETGSLYSWAFDDAEANELRNAFYKDEPMPREIVPRYSRCSPLEIPSTKGNGITRLTMEQSVYTMYPVAHDWLWCEFCQMHGIKVGCACLRCEKVACRSCIAKQHACKAVYRYLSNGAFDPFTADGFDVLTVREHVLESNLRMNNRLPKKEKPKKAPKWKSNQKHVENSAIAQHLRGDEDD